MGGAITQSGLQQGANGQAFLLTQGISPATLVAGKQCLFRLFLDPTQLGQVDTITLRATGAIDGGPRTAFDERDQLIIEPSPPNGPSVGMIVPGAFFPRATTYSVALSAQSSISKVLQQTSFDVVFQPTQDLRLLVVFGIHDGVFNATQNWYDDIDRSMARLGSMLPVRDGVKRGFNTDLEAGLRYVVGQPCDGYVVGYYDCVYGQTRAINASLGDHVDLTVEFRPGLYAPDWNPPGDPGPGGNSGRPPAPYQDLRRASCVAGRWNGIEVTAACIAQELGHNFGLEPPGSPHYQDPNDPGHSKDPFIDDQYAFDFINQATYAVRIGDTMNNLGGGAFQGIDAVAYNAYDWEYLRGGADGRSGLMALDSTGTETGLVGIVGVSDFAEGVVGESERGTAVFGDSQGGDGVVGLTSASSGSAVAGFSGGQAAGVVGWSNQGAGVFGIGGSLAGQFIGDVDVSGNLTKGGGGFRIDHPSDPANRFLNHSFVESAERKNLYDGEVELDARGEAVVELPRWFGEVNEGVRYQLTAVGGPAPDLHVAENVRDGRFRIAGGQAGMRVCWQVSGVRRDPWAQSNPLDVEQEKSSDQRGRYVHPEAHGQPPDRGLVRTPDLPRRHG